MPAFAIIGAMIGTQVIGGAIAGMIGTTIGAGVGGAIAGAIGGAIGGAVGGGLNSVMQGGDFWDGAKGGAIGGALGGAISGFGGMDAVFDTLSGGGAEVASNIPTNVFEGGSLASNVPVGEAASSQLTDVFNPTYNAAPSDLSLSNVIGQGQGLGTPSLGVLAGSAPMGAAQGGQGTMQGMQSTNQVGSQSGMAGMKSSPALKEMFNKDPFQLAGDVSSYYDKMQAANAYQDQLRADTANRSARVGEIYNTGTSLLNTASTNSNDIQTRLNKVFAKYGVQR